MSSSISVSALIKYIKSLITSDIFLKSLIVEGEVSNLTKHPSGHWYFTIKDDESKIDCVMFASNASKVKDLISNGDKVIVSGSVDIYVTSGKYQMYVTTIKNGGVGDLTARFEQLKTKLEAEGLFDLKFKKPIPKYSKDIAIITAKKSAAIKDIVSTIQRRNPAALITIYDTLVQGENAKEVICKQLMQADRNSHDVLVIARGGGSIEDLWNFNEEMVIRTIFELKTPIISGVGHETDTTLCDFVSDMRCETPTAAANSSTYELEAEQKKLLNVDKLLSQLLISKLNHSKNLFSNYTVNNLNKMLSVKLNVASFDYLNCVRNLDDNLNNIIRNNNEELNYLGLRFNNYRLDAFFEAKLSDFQLVDSNLTKSMQLMYNDNLNAYISVHTLLEERSPLNLLNRGYAFTYVDKKLIKSVDDVTFNSELEIRLKDGVIKSKVMEVSKDGRNEI